MLCCMLLPAHLLWSKVCRRVWQLQLKACPGRQCSVWQWQHAPHHCFCTWWRCARGQCTCSKRPHDGLLILLLHPQRSVCKGSNMSSDPNSVRHAYIDHFRPDLYVLMSMTACCFLVRIHGCPERGPCPGCADFRTRGCCL